MLAGRGDCPCRDDWPGKDDWPRSGDSSPREPPAAVHTTTSARLRISSARFRLHGPQAFASAHPGVHEGTLCSEQQHHAELVQHRALADSLCHSDTERKAASLEEHRAGILACIGNCEPEQEASHVAWVMKAGLPVLWGMSMGWV